MKRDINRYEISGYVGKDGKLTFTNGGLARLTWSVATREENRVPGGQDSVTWHDVVLFGKDAEFWGPKIKKGSRCLAIGKLRKNKYKNKAGIDTVNIQLIPEHVSVWETHDLAQGVEDFAEKAKQADQEIQDDDPNLPY